MTTPCQVAQHQSEAQDPNHCQVVRTPILERRRSHRERCRLSYGREYDVTSMMSEIEHLSLYYSSSRKQSVASSVDEQNKEMKRRESSKQEYQLTKSEPSSPGAGCYSENASPGHSYSTETRGMWREEPTPGCCSIHHQKTDYDSLISEQK